MLLICIICEYGHPAHHVECFYSVKEKRHKYLCKAHLRNRNDDLVHMPWDEQLLPESNIEGTCKLCKPTGASCTGFIGPPRPLLIPKNKLKIIPENNIF